MPEIQMLACTRGIPIIEDCAQAFGATSRDGRAGSFGVIACYSLQQGKHMTTGEGGIVATDDAEFARRMFLFVNKAWGYGDKQPDHYFPALNARMTELQGAVALPQLQKLPWVLARRRAIAAAITAGLLSVPGLRLPSEPEGGAHSWWKYAFFVDANAMDGGGVALGARM
jgi:dTDP-4-amino-4,6-dideoxygalactose transaminase